MSLSLDSNISALPIRFRLQAPRAGEASPSHSLFLCQVLGPLGTNRNTRDQKGGGSSRRAEPTLVPYPGCLMLCDEPAMHTAPCPTLLPGVGAGWTLHFWGGA